MRAYPGGRPILRRPLTGIIGCNGKTGSAAVCRVAAVDWLTSGVFGDSSTPFNADVDGSADKERGLKMVDGVIEASFATDAPPLIGTGTTVVETTVRNSGRQFSAGVLVPRSINCSADFAVVVAQDDSDSDGGDDVDITSAVVVGVCDPMFTAPCWIVVTVSTVWVAAFDALLS